MLNHFGVCSEYGVGCGLWRLFAGWAPIRGMPCCSFREVRAADAFGRRFQTVFELSDEKAASVVVGVPKAFAVGELLGNTRFFIDGTFVLKVPLKR